ncbi:SCO6745 family protein [Peterkaempfera bronchialis]|uniref:SCO6745 family protein n=1 Tax=Peterkaempfera bronchialis TaxID=2126346 RepID=UPI003C2F99C5
MTQQQPQPQRPADLRLARAMRDALDPYQVTVVLAPQAHPSFHPYGITHPWAVYFAGRAAPLGAVPASVVDAVFYHFKPALIARFVPAVWDQAGPEKVLAVRLAGVDAALRALLPVPIDSPAIAEAAELAVEAVAACTAAGRPLGAANAALPLPDEPHLRLWQALTTLREWRGDGHSAALLHSGLDAVEALVAITAEGREVRSILQQQRGWSDADWEAAEGRLLARGLLDRDGALTAAGLAVRRDIEDLTDRLALAPWQALGTDRSLRLHHLVRPLSAHLADAMHLPGPRPQENPLA